MGPGRPWSEDDLQERRGSIMIVFIVSNSETLVPLILTRISTLLMRQPAMVAFVYKC